MRFDEEITTLEELREVIAPPSEFVTDKEIDALDDICRDFIARSPFVLIGSTDGSGRVDVSPKGDAPGFVAVLDDTTLAVPDRPGNHRADTLVNIVEHPGVGLIFLIPGTKNTLRVRGRARIVRDAALLDRLEANGKPPVVAIVVEMTTAYFHCAKCVIRSKLWDTDLGESTDERLLAEAMVKHGSLPVSVDDMQAIIVDDEEQRLY